jgi:nitrite reductase/ring-hydroxylating ferredoxin subunit
MSAVVDFLKALGGICETKPLDFSKWELKDDRALVFLDRIPELREPGGAVYLVGRAFYGRILIVHCDDGELRAYSNRCTHSGRRLDPVGGEGILRCCSLFHTTYDYNGENVSGPGKRPLKVYRTEKQGDALIIHF